jgi:hypothetical protein
MWLGRGRSTLRPYADKSKSIVFRAFRGCGRLFCLGKQCGGDGFVSRSGRGASLGLTE